jgi:hypothetical protein
MKRSRDRIDRLFIWGVVLIAFGFSLLPLGWYIAKDQRLLDEAFPWALRVAVLAHLVGAAFVLSSRRSFWVRIPLATVSIAGALVWFLSAFAMI